MTSAAQSSPLEPQLDIAQLNLLRKLRNGTLLPQLLALYRAQTPEQLHRLSAAAQAGNAQELSMLAHALKSASYSIGAKRMGEVCAQLEQQARMGDFRDTTLLCSLLDDHYMALLPEMEALLP